MSGGAGMSFCGETLPRMHAPRGVKLRGNRPKGRSVGPCIVDMKMLRIAVIKTDDME